ncbi:MAG: DEAD/DEAH box helicase [Myxococcota bacterium]
MIDATFAAVRKACPPAIWSRGVELVRQGAVLGERAQGRELDLRVSMQGGMVAPLVTLFPDDAEWSCECPSAAAACIHVAAAVIAVKQAEEKGESLFAPKSEQSTGYIGYRFTSGKGLTFDRVMVTGRNEVALTSTLTMLSYDRSKPFIATQQDLDIEVLLSSTPRGILPRELMAKLLAALRDAPDITLDGRPVTTGEATAGMRARLEDVPEGVRVSIEQDPGVRAVFANGVVLEDETLRPFDEAKVSARDVQDLRRGKIFRKHEIPDLVTGLIPRLARSVAILDLTKSLPKAEKAKPRIHIETSREDTTLSVLATLVYGDPPTARIDGDKLVHLQGAVPVRDQAAERKLVVRLASELKLLPGVRHSVPLNEAVPFARKLQDWSDEAASGAARDFRLLPGLTAKVAIKGNALDLSFFTTDIDGTQREADPKAVLDAFRRGEPLVPLLSGGVAPLPVDFLGKHGERLLDVLAARADDGTIGTAGMFDLKKLASDLGEPDPPGFAKLSALVSGFTSIPKAELPEGLTAELRSYQQRGVDWLAFLRRANLGGILADDMGLGKTVQAITALTGRSLVVAPTSVLFNWHAELTRFRPNLRVGMYYGPTRSLARDLDVVLTSYALLRLDIGELSAQHFDTIVLDEAQAIKNPDSQTTRAAYTLKGDFRITLSGTPVENRLEELWSQMHFVNPGLLGSRKDFDERYAKPIERAEPGAAERLRERVSPFVLRRLKREVAPELPPRTEVVLRCELSETERAIYDVIRAASMRDVVDKLTGGQGNVMQALEALLRLRQVASHAALVPGGEAILHSAKVDLLLEKLDEAVADGHKALVFSQWTSLLDLVERPLNDALLPFTRLDGSTADRGAVVREFQNPDGPPIMLVSLKAGGTGLNLTAADHVFLLDPWWNPAVEDQAADRAHRIGQDKPVMVYRLVAKDTVEERMLDLQSRKRGLADAALGGGDSALRLTRDDLLDLLRE